MRNWKGVLAMGLSAALVISAAQLIPEQNVKSANAETIDNFSDNMTPPSGMPEGTPPAKPDGDTSGKPSGSAPGGAPGGSSSAVTSYDSVKSITSDTSISGETIESTGTDENAINISNGATATIDNSTITRTSSSSTGGDNSSFYGVGAAILNTEGTANITNSTITTDAAGGAGVFSYNKGVTYVSDTTITTNKDTSGGIHVAGGGTLYAWDVTATTSGQSSAAIRSDRGGGTMVVDGGTYTSNGVGSPAVYSTADIAVNNAKLTANGSEAVCIEGLNSLRLFDTSLTGNMSDDSQNDCTWNVILYQSMSGDSQEGNSTFEMNGGTLTAKNGGMFYTTNTESTFILSNVNIKYADDNDFFLRCTGNNNQRGWGTSGSNGADCLFTADSQEMEGDVIWDSISKLDFYMTNGSTLTGALIDDETCAGSGGSGYANVYISNGSTWIVTKDSTLSKLSCEGKVADKDGNTVTIKGTDGTIYVQGTSSVTVTVSEYSDSADLSGASKTTSWSDYKAAKYSDSSSDNSNSSDNSSNDSDSTTSTPAPTATPDATETPSATAAPTDSTVTVKASKVQSAKRSKKRTKAVVKVKSISDITGYQISYSTSKSFNTATKTVNSKKNKITISNLNKKNVYYIKVRTYKTVNKKKYYSKWSSVKKLK